nr:MAG TPA: helix-turn-helix domain protein [Caudoviricetes sp.]
MLAFLRVSGNRIASRRIKVNMVLAFLQSFFSILRFPIAILRFLGYSLKKGGDPVTTGERLKLRRKEIGFSAEKVAEQLGVSPATIYRYEKGDIEKVPVDSLAELAKILQTTPAYLMGWESQSEWKDNNALLAEIHKSEEKEQTRIAEMVRDFKKLNEEGQAKAMERVHELTEIPRYQNIYAIAFDEYKSKPEK